MEIQKCLEKLAYKKTIPFCYSDYIECPAGRCPKCGSDDLLRLLPGNGLDWGISWVLPVLLSENLSPANISEAFEESVRSCYPETTQVCWMNLDSVSVAKEMDPVSWRIAEGEWLDNETEEGNILTFDNGNTYYWKNDVENFIEEQGI